MKIIQKNSLVGKVLLSGLFAAAAHASVIHYEDLCLTNTFSYSAGDVAGSSVKNYSGMFGLTVDGIINSVTVVPNLTIYSKTGEEYPLPSTLAFQITAFFAPNPGIGPSPQPIFPTFNVPSFQNPYTLVPRSSSTTQTFSSLQLAITGNFGEDYFLTPYRLLHMDKEQTIKLQLDIRSIDYTPVPETLTATALIAILAGWMFAVGSLQKNFRRSREALLRR